MIITVIQAKFESCVIFVTVSKNYLVDVHILFNEIASEKRIEKYLTVKYTYLFSIHYIYVYLYSLYTFRCDIIYVEVMSDN